MKSLVFLSFLGFCSPHWTTATAEEPDNFRWIIDGGTLKAVSAMVDTYHIDLSSKKIKDIAKGAFDNVTAIRSLNLSNNELEDLPPLIFSNLNNLEELSLANNFISFVNRPFVGLNNLKHLDLSNNSIVILQRSALFGLTNYTSIIIEGNDLSSLSSRVFQNPSVPVVEFERQDPMSYWKYADESFAPVEQLSDNFEVKICKTDDGLVKSVEQLQQNELLGNCMKAEIIHKERRLILRNLGLRKFQRGWYKLPGNSIYELDLSNNLITDIKPELLNDLRSGLSFIDLHSNKIGRITSNIIENTYLKELDLNDNIITTIENGAFEKTNLIALSVRNNSLNNLTFVTTLPMNLHRFDCSSNTISEIPVDTFRGLKNLRIIDLSKNRLEKIEPGTFEDQKNLLILSLAENEIRELNPGLFKDLKMIHELALMGNKIKRIPRDAFSGLESPNSLSILLSRNEIDTIEEGAFNASRLYELALDNNLITKINGKSFEGISGSYFLDLSGNQIKTIEKGAAEYMENVNLLYLYRNELKCLQNGALYGLSKYKDVEIVLYDSLIKSIQGGVFDAIDELH